MRLAFAFGLALATAGCVRDDLGDASFVEGLRVLGVQAEPPEALVGQSVTLTAWTVDTSGNSVDVAWSACLLPSDGLANPGCTDGSGNGLVPLGSGASITMTVPDVDPTILGAPDATYGVYLPILAHATAGHDASDTIYRLRMHVIVPPECTIDPPYRPGCVPNANPSYAGIQPLLDDSAGATPTKKGTIWALVAEYGGDSMENYFLPGAETANGNSVPEQLRTQWFATAGTFPDEPVGGDAVQKLTMDRALPPAGGIIDLWVVAHDDRGGTGMTHRSFVMQ
ncbi:MAG TPA: hypothetical protein VGL86_07125 [Polyangia bacterium]|jgi:hypothetical protein